MSAASSSADDARASAGLFALSSAAGGSTARDLPLNILAPRMLQNNPQLTQIREKPSPGRVIGELENLGDKEPEGVLVKIWDAFGTGHQGRHSGKDYERRVKKLLALCPRFTTTSGEKRFAEAVCRGTQAEPDRNLLSGR